MNSITVTRPDQLNCLKIRSAWLHSSFSESPFPSSSSFAPSVPCYCSPFSLWSPNERPTHMSEHGSLGLVKGWQLWKRDGWGIDLCQLKFLGFKNDSLLRWILEPVDLFIVKKSPKITLRPESHILRNWQSPTLDRAMGEWRRYCPFYQCQSPLPLFSCQCQALENYFSLKFYMPQSESCS